jgi:general stress protein YciG
VRARRGVARFTERATDQSKVTASCTPWPISFPANVITSVYFDDEASLSRRMRLAEDTARARDLSVATASAWQVLDRLRDLHLCTGRREMPSLEEMAVTTRGFASMDPNKQREIARKGGKAAHQKGAAYEWTAEEAREAGRKGGMAAHRRRTNPLREQVKSTSND